MMIILPMKKLVVLRCSLTVIMPKMSQQVCMAKLGLIDVRGDNSVAMTPDQWNRKLTLALFELF
jgi:hypothetical protein